MKYYRNHRHEKIPHTESVVSRRDFIMRAGGGVAGLALAGMLGFDKSFATPVNPLAAKPGHHLGTAKRVIFLFMEGGPSHLDMFDLKPVLNQLAGKPLPDSFKEPITANGERGSPLLGSPRKWKQYGESGLWVSDWLPNIAKHVDDLAVIRSCWADGLNHAGSICQMNTGSILGGRPSLGAWSVYGLGSLNDNLPAFVVLKDREKLPHGGVRNWGTGFMPATYQGILFQNGPVPIQNLDPPDWISDTRQNKKLDLLNRMNQRHSERHAFDDELEALINAYEMACRMQAEAPEAVDISRENDAIKTLYGMDREITEPFGRQCLLARRLVERGVRFVQVYSGSGNRWDTHSNHEERGTNLCESMDLPVAGLLTDLVTTQVSIA